MRLCSHQGPIEVQVKRNASGEMIGVSGSGPIMLSWLSEAYNFT